MDDRLLEQRQQRRRREILGATLRLLRRHGAGVTTAQIAQEANCSKETLYSWFEDRDGIMLALVREQTAAARDALVAGLKAGDGSCRDRLVAGSTLLLDILTGESSLAVNRTAMAQACAERQDFGEALLAEWQETIASAFGALFEEGNRTGHWRVEEAEEGFDTLIGLLVGDRQRRLLLGAQARPDPAQMAQIAARAVDRWRILFPA